MAKYRVEIKKSAVKEIKKLPKQYLKHVLSKIAALAENPRPEGCIKLTNDNKYRIRVGNYRVLYQIYDELIVVVVVKVAHRKNVYK